MKMTEDNWGRLAVSIFLVIAAVYHPNPFLPFLAAALVTRTVYSYVKGR